MDRNLLVIIVQKCALAWLTMRLQVVGGLLAFGVIVLSFVTDGLIDPALIGLALAYALEMTNFLKVRLPVGFKPFEAMRNPCRCSRS